MTKNQILVQNIETFETITRLTVDVESGETATERIDQYFSKNDNWGIVSLDDDADGEYMSVLLVAPIDGPDFVFDTDTGEMEPVENVDPNVEVATKLDIAMELDMNDASQEDILAMIANEATADENVKAAGQAVIEEWIAESEETITPKKPRKPRKAKTQSNTGAKMRNFEILSAHIESNPGVSRTDVFADAGLQSALRTKAQIAAIAKGDKAEVKRWNRRLNFLIREMRRQGVDIQIERKGRIAHYTIGKPSGQLELPFDDAAEARNAAIIGDDANEVIVETKVDPKRATEEANQSLDFEALLATLDEEAVAPVTK